MARLKTIWPTWTVAQKWIEQTQSFVSNPQHNFWYKDTTIYSYRESWPVGVMNSINPTAIYINSSPYGRTTNTHTSIALGAAKRYITNNSTCYLFKIPLNLYKIPTNKENAIKILAEYYMPTLETFGRSAKLSRSHWPRRWKINRFLTQLNETDEFIKFHNLDFKIALKQLSREEADLIKLTV